MMNLKKYKISDESLDDDDEVEVYNNESNLESSYKYNLYNKSNNSNKNNPNGDKMKNLENNKMIENNKKNFILNANTNTNPHTTNLNKNLVEKRNLIEDSYELEDMEGDLNIYNNNNNKNNIDTSIYNRELNYNSQNLKNSQNSNFQNTPSINNPIAINPYSNSNTNDIENFHHPQIIDEDVESFKRRLDITIKNFRTDTMKEFMSIKRHLLVEQKSVIDSEKQKCDALLSAKIDQIEHLKESLAKTKEQLTIETEIKENLGNQIFKIKNSNYLKKLKILAFSQCLKKFYNKMKNRKTAFNKIREGKVDRFKTKVFAALKKNYEEMKMVKIVQAKEKECNDKLNEMGQYYGKEISDLRAKLNEANLIIESFKNSKNQIQENLKKALMRGVVAMNLEAMNVLEEDPNNSNFNFLENLGMGNIIPESNSKNFDLNLNTNSIPQNNNNFNIHPNINTNFSNLPKISQEERKVVVKDNNWVNACAVPSKLKSEIIASNNSDFEEEPEVHEANFGRQRDYYSELTKIKIIY